LGSKKSDFTEGWRAIDREKYKDRKTATNDFRYNLKPSATIHSSSKEISYKRV